MKATTQKGKRAKENLREGKRIRESVINPYDFAQQRNGECLGQRALKGIRSLESFIATEFLLPVVSRYGVQFCALWKTERW